MVKPGLITIAQFAGVPIVPVITSAERCWTFNSWDRFMVPKPFSRVIIRFTPPIHVPRRLDAEAFETLRQTVEEQIQKRVRQTDAWWETPDSIKRYYP